MSFGRIPGSWSTSEDRVMPCSGQEFAQCPIPPGEKDQAVEAVTDSSRYFVLRLMTSNDARQKAFVGLGFDDRSEAFDFQVALVS